MRYRWYRAGGRRANRVTALESIGKGAASLMCGFPGSIGKEARHIAEWRAAKTERIQMFVIVQMLASDDQTPSRI